MSRFFIALAILLFISISVVSMHTVISPSMEDTLMAGDTFIVLNFWYGLRLPIVDRVIVKGFKPATDDILIFTYPIDPTQEHVKRCVAVSGQTVEIKKKKLFVNGVEIPIPAEGKHADPTIIPQSPYGVGKRDFGPAMVIPDSSLYVLGDNRDFSIDSRIWGFLPEKNLRGKVWFILFSINPDVPWSDMKRKVRWNRFFNHVE